MVIWVATENKGKLSEFKLLLDPLKLDIHSQSELSYFSPPPENGDSFLANARIKTRALKSLKKEFWVVGEDSGLEVEGLGNLPGIHSARYAGPKAGDRENVAKLLKMMELHLPIEKQHLNASWWPILPMGRSTIMEGLLQGELAKKATGTAGFGYDSVFIPEGQTKTLAELGLAFKNRSLTAPRRFSSS